MQCKLRDFFLNFYTSVKDDYVETPLKIKPACKGALRDLGH